MALILLVPQFEIEARFLPQKVVMAPDFLDSSIVHDHNAICIANRA